MAGNSGKVPTDGGSNLGQNPFGALSSAGLPVAPKAPPGPTPKAGGPSASPASGGPATSASAKDSGKTPPQKNRGRVDIRRETGGRGGKTVTLVDGFTGIGLPEKESLCKKMRSACGCGGTVKDGAIEIQGDQRETIARILTEAGFRPVFAGG